MPRTSSQTKKPAPVPSPTVSNHEVMNPMNIAQPSFGSTLKQGLAFGIGNSIAHRLIGAPVSIEIPQKKENLPCEKERLAFEACLKTTSSDVFCGSEQMVYKECIQTKKD